jgi:hypothetical protein
MQGPVYLRRDSGYGAGFPAFFNLNFFMVTLFTERLSKLETAEKFSCLKFQHG